MYRLAGSARTDGSNEMQCFGQPNFIVEEKPPGKESGHQDHGLLSLQSAAVKGCGFAHKITALHHTLQKHHTQHRTKGVQDQIVNVRYSDVEKLTQFNQDRERKAIPRNGFFVVYAP